MSDFDQGWAYLTVFIAMLIKPPYGKWWMLGAAFASFASAIYKGAK